MSPVNRRDLLRALVVGAGIPLPTVDFPQRRRVGIVGGGMAGVSLAWLLDGACDVVVLEAKNSIGGNIRDVEVELDGGRFLVDIGAQYFHPGPYPTYTTLLTHLGLHKPDSPASSQTHAFPASITLTGEAGTAPRFVSPIVPDRIWPFFAPWNFAGIWAFGIGFYAAKTQEELQASWAVTLDEWLPTLGLAREQWEGMLLPWAASLFSGSIEQTRGLSARAVMIFAAKALPANPFDPLLYYALVPSMAEVLHRMIAQMSTVEIMTGTPVLRVTRQGARGFRLHCANERSFGVDDLVFAASGPATQRLLETLPGTSEQLAALQKIEFYPSRLALHTDPIYATASPLLWSFFNARIQGAFCEASMWLKDVLAGVPSSTRAKLWKSWITHRAQPPSTILHEAEFTHVLPTPGSIAAQEALATLQGRGGIWLAGGYLSPYDSQETALLSALSVAAGLHVATPRQNMLLPQLHP